MDAGNLDQFSKIYYFTAKTEIIDALKLKDMGWLFDFPQTITKLQIFNFTNDFLFNIEFLLSIRLRTSYSYYNASINGKSEIQKNNLKLIISSKTHSNSLYLYLQKTRPTKIALVKAIVEKTKTKTKNQSEFLFFLEFLLSE